MRVNAMAQIEGKSNGTNLNNYSRMRVKAMAKILTTIPMTVNAMAQIEGKSNGTNLNNY